jgi:hypothetical protein
MFGVIMNGFVINCIRTIFAKERIRRANYLFFQGCGGQKGFEKRTRFKDIGDRSIPPAFRTILDELIGIEIRIGYHGQDLSG